MIKIAIYGKGGIGKSTTASNIAAAFAQSGMRVMQIGCDPKADSTVNLRGGRDVPTVLELIRNRGEALTLEEMVTPGFAGVLCAEAGGPAPGLGCAGRGIIAAQVRGTPPPSGCRERLPAPSGGAPPPAGRPD